MGQSLRRPATRSRLSELEEILARLPGLEELPRLVKDADELEPTGTYYQTASTVLVLDDAPLTPGPSFSSVLGHWITGRHRHAWYGAWDLLAAQPDHIGCLLVLREMTLSSPHLNEGIRETYLSAELKHSIHEVVARQSVDPLKYFEGCMVPCPELDYLTGSLLGKHSSPRDRESREYRGGERVSGKRRGWGPERSCLNKVNVTCEMKHPEVRVAPGPVTEPIPRGFLDVLDRLDEVLPYCLDGAAKLFPPACFRAAVCYDLGDGVKPQPEV